MSYPNLTRYPQQHLTDMPHNERVECLGVGVEVGEAVTKHARVLANDKGNFTTFKFNLPGVAIKQEPGSKTTTKHKEYYNSNINNNNKNTRLRVAFLSFLFFV